MGKIENFVTLLLLLVLPGQFIVQVLPYYGLSSISSFIVASRFILSLAIMFYMVSHADLSIVTKECKRLFALYVLYFSYIIFYVFLSPKISRELMMDVPDNNFVFFRTLLQQTVFLLVFSIYANKINFVLFAKWTTLITLLCIFAYFNVVDFRVYGVLDYMDHREAIEEELNIIGVFGLSRFIAYGFCSAISLYRKWSKNIIFDRLVLYSTSIVSFIGLLLIVKRGPIISALLTFCILLYYSYRKMSSGKKIAYFILLIAVLISFDFLFLSIAENFENGIIYRFTNLFDDGGSGRIGGENSEFSITITQFLSSPFWGSYFRLTSGENVGEYPHNIILELLITFGIISIFYFMFLWSSIKKSIDSVSARNDMLPVALIFFYSFIALMFSSSLIFQTSFWMSIAVLQGYTNNNTKILQ